DAIPRVDVGVVERRDVAARPVGPPRAGRGDLAHSGDRVRVPLGFTFKERVPACEERLSRLARRIAIERLADLVEQREARRAGAVGRARCWRRRLGAPRFPAVPRRLGDELLEGVLRIGRARDSIEYGNRLAEQALLRNELVAVRTELGERSPERLALLWSSA